MVRKRTEQNIYHRSGLCTYQHLELWNILKQKHNNLLLSFPIKKILLYPSLLLLYFRSVFKAFFSLSSIIFSVLPESVFPIQVSFSAHATHVFVSKTKVLQFPTVAFYCLVLHFFCSTRVSRSAYAWLRPTDKKYIFTKGFFFFLFLYIKKTRALSKTIELMDQKVVAHRYGVVQRAEN